MLGLKRGADENLFPSGTLSEVVDIMVSEVLYRYCNAELVVARYCGELTLPQAYILNEGIGCWDYCDDVHRKASWNLAGFIATD